MRDAKVGDACSGMFLKMFIEQKFVRSSNDLVFVSQLIKSICVYRAKNTTLLKLSQSPTSEGKKSRLVLVFIGLFRGVNYDPLCERSFKKEGIK